MIERKTCHVMLLTRRNCVFPAQNQKTSPRLKKEKKSHQVPNQVRNGRGEKEKNDVHHACNREEENQGLARSEKECLSRFRVLLGCAILWALFGRVFAGRRSGHATVVIANDDPTKMMLREMWYMTSCPMCCCCCCSSSSR